MANTKQIDLSFDEVNALLAYDRETGVFTWRVAPSRRIRAGAQAGMLKSVRAGEPPRYWYIAMKGIQTPATRVAWLLETGAWPETNILFKDGDGTNMRFDNLKPADYPTTKEMRGGRRVYKMSIEASRHYGRKHNYGMTGEEYGAMMAAQKGVCAICARPETAMLRGTPKTMHVDHDHETGQLRSLLCGACNGMLGLAKDNPATLRAAADYLEHHAAQPRKVISGKFAVTDKGAA